MGPHIGVLRGRTQGFLSPENVHEAQQPAGGLLGGVEQPYRRLIGGVFLGSGELEEASLRDPLLAGDDGRTHIRPAADGGDATQNITENGMSGCVPGRAWNSRQMSP